MEKNCFCLNLGIFHKKHPNCFNFWWILDLNNTLYVWAENWFYTKMINNLNYNFSMRLNQSLFFHRIQPRMEDLISNCQLFITFSSIKASFLQTFFTDHNISLKFIQLHVMNFQLLIILCGLSQTFGDGPCIYEHHYCNPTAFDLIRKVTEVIIEDRSECEAKCTE